MKLTSCVLVMIKHIAIATVATLGLSYVAITWDATRLTTHNDVPVYTSDRILNVLSGSGLRGIALGWVIVVRPLNEKGQVCAIGPSGDRQCKYLANQLRHEYTHIQQQRRLGMAKFMWQWFFSKEGHNSLEKEAINAENQ